jgi:hypothetical protein
MAKRKGLLGKTKRQLEISKKQSANKAAKSGYKAPKKRTGPNKEAAAMAKATVKGKAPVKSKLSKFGKAKLAVKQKALSAKGAAKAAGRKAKASVSKNTRSTSSIVKNKTANLSRRISGMKDAAKLGFGAGKAGNNKGITTKSGAKVRANLTNKRSGLTQAGTIASLYGGNAVGKAARGLSRVGTMSAAHRKAISDGLKKRFGRK